MMEVSMRDLFPACVSVLDQEKTPVHYGELTRLALKSLGIRESQTLFHKERENVREKLLQAGQRGTFYTGPPLYAGALRQWFVRDSQLSMTLDVIEMPGSAQAGVDGAFEALMRAPYMMQKSSAVHTERLNRVRSSGLVLEQHIAQWFSRRYPSLYLDADNQGQWQRPCDHDFKLSVDGRVYKVDVAGPSDNGTFKKSPYKKATDFHLLCYVNGDNCVFESVVRGSAYNEHVDPQSVFSPTAFVVWLNCKEKGIDYKAAEQALCKPAVKAA